MDQDYKIKTLGLAWKPNADHFQFFSNFDNRGSITKRQLLSDTAKLFDPVGWFGPIVIKFKILLQKLWTRGVDWDEQLPQDLLEEGIAIKADLHHLHDFYLPRCILPPNTKSIQIHLFTAAALLHKNNQQVLPKSQWRHVTTASNPADGSSRGTTMESLKQAGLWWHGPLWLAKPENEWPQINSPAVKVTEEKRQSKTDKLTRSTHEITNAIGTHKSPMFDCSRYSSFMKFFRVVATVKIPIRTFMKRSNSKHIEAHDLIQVKIES